MIIYNLGNMADWLSAIGTISAVVVALYLSNKQAKPKAKVTAKNSYYVDNVNGFSSEPFQISVEIVNLGSVPIHLTECTVKIGKEKAAFTNGCHNVDKLLSPGERHINNLDYPPIKKYLLEKKIRKLKTYVYYKDASGKTYKSKITLRSY